MELELVDKIRNGEVNINHQQIFFSNLIKGLIHDLNNEIEIRSKYIPHYIVNTGDDIMYLEVKHQDHSIEPLENSNEAFVYTQVPRCIVTTEDISIDTSQLTSPYTKGIFQVEINDTIYGIIAEYRRVPIKMNIKLHYIMDSFTDCLDVSQQLINKFAFIRNYTIIYLGQTINCTYKFPDSISHEKTLEFDGQTTDSKTKNIDIELELESNLPILYSPTTIPADKFIKYNSWSINDWKHIQIESPEMAKKLGDLKLFNKGNIDENIYEIAIPNEH